MSHQPTCRFCKSPLNVTFVDLAMQPLCQDHVKPEELNQMEPHYPLHAYVCEQCYLVQLEEFVAPDKIFDDYAYFSSYSDSWLKHAKMYTELVTKRFNLSERSLVAEIASNDGYLLQYFKEANIPILGIEPAENVAKVAIEEKDIPTEIRFFGIETAKILTKNYPKPDLLLGNNVLAHVPDINDFVGGMKLFLNESGVITMEFPHLQKLIDENQFDTIYHEHFSYLSFTAVDKIFRYHGLELFDVQELPTHGGSLRIYAKHLENKEITVSVRVQELLDREEGMGFKEMVFYQDFEEKVKNTKRKLLDLLISLKKEGKSIIGYGAPGKGNTLLNYCGIRTDFLDFTVDRNPFKQNNFLPGTLIPIYDPAMIAKTKPDYVMILPWNLKEEIMEQLDYIREWGGKFIIPIPEAKVLN